MVPTAASSDRFRCGRRPSSIDSPASAGKRWYMSDTAQPASPARTIAFAGRRWTVKSSGGLLVGPGPNVFSDSARNVWVDRQQHLHLRITRAKGVWCCAEIAAREVLGYGRYVFTVGPMLPLDRNVVLGLFLYADDTREIDVEVARFGDEFAPHNAQFVVQPLRAGAAGFRHPFHVPRARRPVQYEIEWHPDRVAFRSHYLPGADGSAMPIANAATTRDVPRDTRSHPLRARMNLWLYADGADRGRPPAGDTDVEVVVSSFTHRPS